MVMNNVICRVVDCYFDDIVDHDEAANDERLTNLNSINARINVYSISTKDRYVTHVNVIKNA